MVALDELPEDKVISMYRTMVLMRRFDQVALQLRLDGRIDGVVHPYFGQEAIAAGVISALREGDKIVSNHRGHGHVIAKGAEVKRMFAELFGRRDGYCRGKGGSMHIAEFDCGIVGANGIVGAGLPIGAGSALASQLRGDDSVVAVFFGEGATGQGVFHESLNYSTLAKLPVLWVCENNGYAVGNPLHRTIPVGSIESFVSGYGLPVKSVDGTDLAAVWEAATAAVDQVRTHGGPVLIECRAFRLGVHSQRGIAMPETRPVELMEEALKRDPIRLLENRLMEAGALTAERIVTIREEIDRELDDAITFAVASPVTEASAAYAEVYA